MALVYLYKYREYVGLVQADKNVPNINLPMIIYDTKIYKGVTNTIDFVIRNNDRKPISMVGYSLVAQIRQVNNQSGARVPTEVLLEKNVSMVDETTGKAKLVLDPNDIEDWSTGYYEYCIKTLNQSGVYELLYTDINKNTLNSFELLEGMASSIEPPVEITALQLTPTPINWQYDTRWVTGALPGDAQAQRASGTHTIVAYSSNWQGKIWVEGSLNNDPPLPNEWFEIPLRTDKNYLDVDTAKVPGPIAINFTMNLYWIRVVVQPTVDNKGKFEKILYKN